MEVACDRHTGPKKDEGLAFQIALRSRNVSTHGLLTAAAQSPEKARAIMQLLKETADKMEVLLTASGS